MIKGLVLRLSLIALILLAISACSLEIDVPTSNGGGGAKPPTTAPNVPQGETGRVTYVIDGDTVDVEINGETYRVRYVGVNTPESDEVCYQDAKNANSALVMGKTVTLVRDQSDTDRYDRLLRYVYVDGGTFVNERLVGDGWAEAVEYPPDTLYTAHFRDVERQAQTANLGCHPTGIFNDGSMTR